MDAKNKIKYSFHAIFSGIGQNRYAKAFYAPSSNKAHKLRSQISRSDKAIFVSGIQKEPSVPMILSMRDFPTMGEYTSEGKHAGKRNR